MALCCCISGVSAGFTLLIPTPAKIAAYVDAQRHHRHILPNVENLRLICSDMQAQKICLLAGLLFSLTLQAQNPYERVDSIMRAYEKKVNTEEDLWRLSYFIRHTFTEDSLRLRAAFIWITKNIEYDIKAFQNDDNRAAQLHYVLRKKRAICSGYANLLKYFCDTYKIENELITGRARALRSDIHITNMRFQSNHAWNAVKINNQWRLIDPTWAAGVITDEDERDEVVKLKYQASLEEFYYFTPPERFSLNHYPSDLRFSFVPKTGTYKEFAQAPLLTTEYLKGHLIGRKSEPCTGRSQGR
jgi:hypothetical protein